MPIIVLCYMIAAFTWWAILLSRQNDQIYALQKDSIQTENIVAQEKIASTYKRKKAMIIGEGIVFTVALIFGIYLIYRSSRKEVKLFERQRNFLLSVSHELKSPIASIKLGMETIRNRSLDKSKVDNISSIAHKEATRLEKLVNNILTATSIDYSYQPSYRKTNLENIKKKILEFSSQHGDRIDLSLEGNSNQMFKFDIEGFLIIIDNLIDNAAKYSEDRISVNIQLHSSKITSTVKDLGVGISNEEKKLVFNRFYRVGSEEIRTQKGTGLGMFIVDKILQNNKGQITLKDNEPNGLVVQFKMPVDA